MEPRWKKWIKGLRSLGLYAHLFLTASFSLFPGRPFSQKHSSIINSQCRNVTPKDMGPKNFDRPL